MFDDQKTKFQHFLLLNRFHNCHLPCQVFFKHPEMYLYFSEDLGIELLVIKSVCPSVNSNIQTFIVSYTHGLFAQILPYIREKFLFNHQNRVKVKSFPFAKRILTTRLYLVDSQASSIHELRSSDFSKVHISVHVLFRFSDNSFLTTNITTVYLSSTQKGW